MARISRLGTCTTYYKAEYVAFYPQKKQLINLMDSHPDKNLSSSREFKVFMNHHI